MPTIKGKYGEYKVTAQQHKRYSEQNAKNEHKSLMRSVKKDFPGIKVNGESPFKKALKAKQK